MTEHELDILLRDYGGAVRSVCRAILPGHPQDAEEAEADTFYKLWRGAHLPADETHRRRLVVRTAPDGELFLRRYVYGETAAQLGVHFNMPAATVRTRLHRARLALQKLLKEG